jgi:hypothetical protein
MEQMMKCLLAKMDTTQALLAKMNTKMKTWREEMTVCQEVMEACLESKEPTSLEVGSGVGHLT